METQSTITDSITEQVERAQPAEEETLRESPRAVEPPLVPLGDLVLVCHVSHLPNGSLHIARGLDFH